jgi:uncharacterized protein
MMLPEPLLLACDGAVLTAMLHRPSGPAKAALLMVPGGSDYRIGSHRGFVRLADALAVAGVMVLRLDVRGMGDSQGMHPGFETLDADLAAGVTALRAQAPQLPLFLYGQCDGATASLLSSDFLSGLSGLILANPWARGSDSDAAGHQARMRLRNRSSWIRLLRGEIGIDQIFLRLRDIVRPRQSPGSQTDYRTRMLDGLRRDGPPLMVLAGQRDATGQEFLGLVRPERLKRLELHKVEQGDHSFSTAAQRQQILSLMLGFMARLSADHSGS